MTFIVLFIHDKFVFLSFSRSALRNWDVELSKDGRDWLTVFSHRNDTSLNEPG